MIDSINKERFIKDLQSMIGTPFRHRGRSARGGVDCIGLVAVNLLKQGCAIVDKKVYGREPRNDRLKENVDSNLGKPIFDITKHGQLYDVNFLEKGDIVLIKFNIEPHHVAVVNKSSAGYTLIHAYGAVERVVEHSIDKDWLLKITHVYRLQNKD